MGQVFQDAKSLADNFMAFATLEVGYEADTAGVVFIGRVIRGVGVGGEFMQAGGV